MKSQKVKLRPHSLHKVIALNPFNLSTEFVNLYFTYAGQGLVFFFFRWWQKRFEFQLACVAVEGRSNVVINMHAQLQISLPMRFLSLLHQSCHCAFGSGVCRLLTQQFQSFASLKQQQNFMKIMFSCIHFTIWPYPIKIMTQNCIHTSKLGWHVC